MGNRRQLNGRRRRVRAFTLAEIMIAGLVMAVLFGGLLRMAIQSRRTTETSLAQSGVIAAVEAYLAQIQTMDYNVLVASPSTAPAAADRPTLATRGRAGEDPVFVSWGTPPTADTAGVAPINGIANERRLDFKTPSVRLIFWIWVQDYLDPNTRESSSKGITIVYHYTIADGGRTRWLRGSLRSIRTAVPKY